MPPLTNLEKQQRKIERERAAGFVRRTVTIHLKRDAELKEIVAKWKKEDSKHDDHAVPDGVPALRCRQKMARKDEL